MPSCRDAFKNLPKYFSGEEWVLGPKTGQNVDTTKVGQDLQARYQQDYINQWRAFLKNANVVHYNSLADASQKLVKTSSNQSPLLALFCVAAQNTSVDQPDISKAFQPVQAVVPPNCSGPIHRPSECQLHDWSCRNPDLPGSGRKRSSRAEGGGQDSVHDSFHDGPTDRQADGPGIQA